MSRIFAFMTASVIRYSGDTEDCQGYADYTEDYGWISPDESRTDLLESRNYARPVVDCPEDWHETYNGTMSDDEAETVADYVREALEAFGPYEDNGNGTFYAVDPYTDPETGDVYTYAPHFTRKELNPRATDVYSMYREVPWHPRNVGVEV